MKEEINLIKIFEIILRLWWVVLIFAIIGSLIAFSISTFLMTPMYTSTAKVYVSGSERVEGSGVNINDINVSQSEDWKSFTAAFLDESFLIGYLTPTEYFKFIADLRGVSQADLDVFLQPFSGFFNDEILNNTKYIRDLSKGNQKKVGIAGAFIGNPKVVILDEPFANLDPTTQIRLKNLLKEFAAQKNTTMLISSHDLQHTVEVSNRIVALQKGQVVKDIQTDENTMNELQSLFAI